MPLNCQTRNLPFTNDVSKCNKKCSYCNEYLSSTWATEINEFGKYPTRAQPVPPNTSNIEILPVYDYYSSVTECNISGGEPLISPEAFQLLSCAVTLPNPELSIKVASNLELPLSVYADYVDLCKKLAESPIKEFTQYITLHGGNSEHSDYIYGPNQQYLTYSRIASFLQSVPDSKVVIVIPVTNLTFFGLRYQLDDVDSHRYRIAHPYGVAEKALAASRVDFRLHRIDTPAWHSLQILPPKFAEILVGAKQSLTESGMFSADEIQRVQDEIDLMRNPTMSADEIKAAKADFFRFYTEYDKRRNTDFLLSFPVLTQFWNECRYLAEHE